MYYLGSHYVRTLAFKALKCLGGARQVIQVATYVRTLHHEGHPHEIPPDEDLVYAALQGLCVRGIVYKFADTRSGVIKYSARAYKAHR